MLRLISKSSITSKEAGGMKLEYISFWKLFKYTLNMFKSILKYSQTLIRSTIIGLLVGMLPAAGATIASLFAYKQAEMYSKNKDNFGKGEPEGVIAPEAANNACQPGAMTTTLAFGIPGSGASAILMAVFIMSGMRVGPFLLREDMDLFTLLFGVLACVSCSMLVFFLILLKVSYFYKILVSFLSLCVGH